MGRWGILRFLIVLFQYMCFSVADEQKFGMCGDPHCSEPVAYGTTNQRYTPDEINGLSFQPNERVQIFVRNYGEKNKLGVKINGKKGYVPNAMVKEVKSLKKATFPAEQDFMDEHPVQIPDHSISPTSHDVNQALNMLPTISSSVPVGDTAISEKTETEEQQHVVQTPSTSLNSALESTNVPGLATPSLHENGRNVKHDIPDQHKDPKEKVPDEGLSISSMGSTSSSPKKVRITLPSSEHRNVNTANPLHKAPESSLDSAVTPQKTEKLSSYSENSITNDIVVNVEQTVKETVEALEAAYTGSVNSNSDVDPEVADKEMMKTMKMLEERGLDTNNIFDEETAITSSTDNYFNFVSESHTVGKTSDISQTTESTTMSINNSINLDAELDGSSFNDTSIIQPSSAANYQDVEAKSDEATPPAENSHTLQKDHMPEKDEENTDNINENASENALENDDNENDEAVDNSNDDRDQDFDDDYENLVPDKLETSSVPASIDDDDNNGRNVDSSSNETDGTDFYDESEGLASLSNADHTVNRSDHVEFDVKSEAFNHHANDVSEKEEEFFAVDDETQEMLNDNFDLDPDAHVSPQRQILQDNNSGSATVAYNSNDPSELVDTQNPMDAFPESSEHNNPNSNTKEMMETTSIFSVIAVYETCNNTIAALRTLLDYVILWIPEPINSYINTAGISARAAVFTGIIAFPCALLFLATFFLKERSKEESLKDLLRETEHKLYMASTERDILRDEAKNLKQQLLSTDTSLAEEKSVNAEIQKRLEEMEFLNDSVNSIQKTNIDVIKELHMKNDEYVKQISDLQLSLDEAKKQNSDIMVQLREEQNAVAYANDEIAKLKQDIDELEAEKEMNENNYYENEKSFKEKITQLEQSCSQLLQEAEAWNSRVNELSEQYYSQASSKEELEKLINSKDSEIESLKIAFSNMEVFQNLKTSGEDEKTVEEKMKAFMDVSSVQNDLQKAEEINKSLTGRLQQERKKVLDMEVELLESRSDVEKMRVSYNQALQDKAEAQTKLDVLTKYFKDKELQLQKELGVQEAVRQRKEEDATHAERRVILIEKENESYKYQVASLKQEIEETERNLKNQIAAQEKKAHENWLAARAAERKAEEMKQESASLRQRLTLLEREQENWLNSSQSDIVRPVPQRLLDTHDLSGSQEGSISSEFIPRHMPPPGIHDDLPLPMRPSSRPLLPPGVPPPPVPMMPPPPPHFMPSPFDPMMPPPHRPQPWRMLPEKHFDPQRRNTPSDFEASMPRRRQTPPYYDNDRRSLSPADANSRSRGSSPHEPLPDFHNVPPHLQRHPEYYPPGQPPRFPPPMHRPYKSLQSFRTGNQLGNDGNRSLNDKEFRQQHTDADV